MASLMLEAKTPLDGYRESFGDTILEEMAGNALVAIATPRGGAQAFQSAVQAAYGCAVPVPGSSEASDDGAVRFLGLQQDQVFALFPYAGNEAVTEIRNALGDNGYYTDQSDSWAMLRLSGEAALPALERLCPLDLDETAFPLGSVARTVMEHMGSIILREGTDAFILMAARSSAANFVHAVELSIHNVT